MATDPNQPPTPTSPNPGRDQIDKQLADTLKLLADVLEKSRPPVPPVPPIPKSPPDPAAQQQVFARTVLAAVITGLPNLVARVAVGPQISSDPAERAEQIKSLREQRRKSAEDAELGGGGGLVGKGAGVAGAIGGMVAMKFAAVLGPLAIFQQMLSANNSGMGVLHKSVQVLAAVLGPVVLPVAVLLAAALVQLSDDIQKGIQPELKEWTRLIIETYPHIKLLAQYAAEAAIALGKVVSVPKVTDETVTAKHRSMGGDAFRAGMTREQTEAWARSWGVSDRFAKLPGGSDRTERAVRETLEEFDWLVKNKADRKAFSDAERVVNVSGEDRVPQARAAIQEGQTREQWAQKLDAIVAQKKLTPEQAAAAKPNWLAAFELAQRDIEADVSRLMALGSGREGIAPEFKRQIEGLGGKIAPEFERQLTEVFDRLRTQGRGGPESLEPLARSAVGGGQTRDQFAKEFEAHAADLKLSAEQAAAGRANWMEAFERARVDADKRNALQGALGGAAFASGERMANAPGAVTPTGGAAQGSPSTKRGAASLFDDGALRDVIQSFRLSLAPRASFTGLENVFQQTQLRALNQDPLDARIAKAGEDAVSRLDEVISEMKGLRGDLAKPGGAPARKFDPKSDTGGGTGGR